MPTRRATLLLPVLLALGCAHRLTPAQSALRKRGGCVELLAAADEARAAGDKEVAHELVTGCGQDAFLALVASAQPAQALLLCGRARAAQNGSSDKPSCDASRVSELMTRLRPRITIGPPDPQPVPEPALAGALQRSGPQLGLAYAGDDPMVIIGRLEVMVEHQQNASYTSVPDAAGKRRSIPATAHRLVARAEGQAELGGKTRTLRASVEARDLTWEAAPRLGIAARPVPQVPDEAELRERAAEAWLTALARNLAQSPPEGVDTNDAVGCVAYALALRADSGDPDAAANGGGDPDRVDACVKLLGLPDGAGIPMP